jgi:hypothetical protein
MKMSRVLVNFFSNWIKNEKEYDKTVITGVCPENVRYFIDQKNYL